MVHSSDRKITPHSTFIFIALSIVACNGKKVTDWGFFVADHNCRVSCADIKPVFVVHWKSIQVEIPFENTLDSLSMPKYSRFALFSFVFSSLWRLLFRLLFSFMTKCNSLQSTDGVVCKKHKPAVIVWTNFIHFTWVEFLSFMSYIIQDSSFRFINRAEHFTFFLVFVSIVEWCFNWFPSHHLFVWPGVKVFQLKNMQSLVIVKLILSTAAMCATIWHTFVKDPPF